MRFNHDGVLTAHQIEQGSHGSDSIAPRAKNIRRRTENVISNTQRRVLFVQNAVSVTDDIAPLLIGHSLMLRQKKCDRGHVSDWAGCVHQIFAISWPIV
jgi:hypothetical protein